MAESRSRHIFGPVPSRRLGRSLGVDIVPCKVCSYDCVYCQLGRTSQRTLERREYVAVSEIVADVEAKLASGCEFDYITISGSGEPTLNSRIGDIIAEIKKRTEKPLAVLTNGSLLWEPEVRANISGANLVIPSLDAGCQEFFEMINRPCPELSFEKMLYGLECFSKEFEGLIWLEVFLLGGLIDPYLQIKGIPELAGLIAPDAVQLNTVARPPCEKCVTAVPREILENLSKLFKPKAEVIAEFSATGRIYSGSVVRDDILELLERRPCTALDIAVTFNVHHLEMLKELEHLVEAGRITAVQEGDKVFYKSLKRGK